MSSSSCHTSHWFVLKQLQQSASIQGKSQRVKMQELSGLLEVLIFIIRNDSVSSSAGEMRRTNYKSVNGNKKSSGFRFIFYIIIIGPTKLITGPTLY